MRFVESARFVSQEVDAFTALESPSEKRGDRKALRVEMGVNQLKDCRRDFDMRCAADLLDKSHVVQDHFGGFADADFHRCLHTAAGRVIHGLFGDKDMHGDLPWGQARVPKCERV